MKKTAFSNPLDTWNKRFSDPDFIFGKEPNAYLASHRGLFQQGKKALAVADGEGRNSVWLAGLGIAVDAFDISPVGVDKARRLAQEQRVSVNFNVSDCDSWAWQPASYDYVVAIFVQFADPDLRRRLFAGMSKTLKPGGYLILQGYTPKQLEYNTGGPGILEHLYTEQMLRASFAELDILDLQVYEATLSEGARHSGPSALIGMLARKK